VPLEDVALADVAAIETLIRIFDVVAALDGDAAAAARRPAAEWCALVEAALLDLCGPECTAVAEPLREVRRLRDAANATPVPFADVKRLLADDLAEVPGRQPLRTGAITATSMVPLRGVPFRVVCVAGYDDGAVGGSDVEAEDLVSRQQLLGDIDARIDGRRSLLDCLRAARDRFIVTCNGISLRTNAPIPLVTPLAELVDFAVRHGVERADPLQPAAIEMSHPRHAVGRRNFQQGRVQAGRVWSHDANSRSVAAGMGRPRPPAASRETPPLPLPVTEFALLEEMVRDPLRLYLRKTLGIATWRDDDAGTPAVFPLGIAPHDHRTLARQLLDLLAGGVPGDDEAAREARWMSAVRQAGLLPFGTYGDGMLAEIHQLAHGLRDGAADPKKPVPLVGFESLPLRIALPSGLLVGHLSNVHRGTGLLVDVHVGTCDRNDRGLPLHLAALRLLAAHAAGESPDHAVVFGRHSDWTVDDASPVHQLRAVHLADALRSRQAAAARLDEIGRLVPLALAAPRGRFGKAAHTILRNRDSGQQQFAQHVGRPGFQRSAEATVYGMSPRFDDVLAEDSPEMRFHTTLHHLLDPQWQPKGRRYVVS
jgi:exonuclease V gamma subunit